MNNTITFKHSGNTGDIIYSLAGIKHVVEELNGKAELCFWMNRRTKYYDGAVHPLGGLMFNKYMLDNLRPLLLSQSYIAKVSKYKGQQIHVDLDLIRSREVGMPNGSISLWYSYVFPDMACDIGAPWLFVEGGLPELKDAILVNRTERYRNPHVSYAFLRHRKERVLFTGTPGEYDIFKKEVPTASYLQCANFHDLARSIASCKFFIGNQSMCYAIAEGLKVPRLLEVCTFAPNVIPAGPGPAYGFLNLSAFEYYVKRLCGDSDAQPKSFPDQGQLTHVQLVAEPSVAKFPEGYRTFIGGATIDYRPEIEGFSQEVVNNTLVDYLRLDKLRQYTRETDKLPIGDVAEVGVYKGGTARLIRENSRKTMYLFDTFSGMPPVSEHDLHHEGDFKDTSMKEVRELILNKLEHWVETHFHSGRFPQELTWYQREHLQAVKFSLVHLDVDIYKSVKDCLEFFYPIMVKGGIIVLDDVLEPNCPGARKAFDEFMMDKPESKQPGWLMVCQSQVAFRKI